MVLMHHERRSTHTYPLDLTNVSQLPQYGWETLLPNVGACMSVRRMDALHVGGFDEHPSFKGYFCGPYDLAWRLVNAGLPEIWHDERVTLWHFAHPDPPATLGQTFSWKLWREVTYPHIDRHALTAVIAFSTGRILPLRENPRVYERRMAGRRIGSAYEARYAWLARSAIFPMRKRLLLHLALVVEPFRRCVRDFMRAVLQPAQLLVLRDWWHAACRAKQPFTPPSPIDPEAAIGPDQDPRTNQLEASVTERHQHASDLAS